jgi:transcription elongation factor GreA
MTQSTDQGTIWLTQEAFDKLTAELENLKGPVRQEVIARISAARDEGDLKENGGYHAAKDEQGKIEARIRQLEDMLRRAQVGETPPDDGIVEPGMKVTYRFVGDDDASTFLLGAREIEDDSLVTSGPPNTADPSVLVTGTAGSVLFGEQVLTGGRRFGSRNCRVTRRRGSPAPAGATAPARRAAPHGSRAGGGPRPRRGAATARSARA